MRADQVQAKLDELEALIDSERRVLLYHSPANELQRQRARDAIKYYERRMIEVRNAFHAQLGDL